MSNSINVSFSTIPPRYNNLERIINSFYEQTLRPNKIIITIPQEYYRFSHNKKEIENICNRYKDFVHLLYVDNDYGPATKIYGGLKTLELYPDSSVMICDDDVLYDNKLIECYSKALENNNSCVWSTDKSECWEDTPNYGVNGNYFVLPSHKIPKLQGVDTYLFTKEILKKINSSNFENYYFDFLSKNTNIKSLEEVFLHDDYYISLLLYDLQIPIGFFYLKYPVYDVLVAESQIHESIKCHSDEVQLIQKIYQNYENSNPIIRCIFTDVNGKKTNEVVIRNDLNIEKYHEHVINTYKQNGPFKIKISINTEKNMNVLLDKKTNDIQEFYDWQIKYDRMSDDNVDYLFRLKYWNNFNPKVIYDIGSNYLSWYRLASNVWRESKIYCIDAFSGFADVYPRYNVDYAIELLSNERKQVEFYENPTCPGLCTLYKVNEEYDKARNFYNDNLYKTFRETKTLDTLVKEKNWAKPDLIKMDVQGAEVDVIQGAQEVISNCNHLILEVQHREFSTGAPLLNDVEEYLKSIDFILLHRISLNGHDGDYHFVRKNLIPA